MKDKLKKDLEALKWSIGFRTESINEKKLSPTEAKKMNILDIDKIIEDYCKDGHGES